ncbi:MAG: hypothetical protein U9N62_12930 [Thermotogota bacterium]|nr:hypothetical protein [Thermotogota bacterium]
MKTLKSCRDITVIENTPYIVIATDSSGSIGEKEGDHLHVKTEIAAAHCLRVCLNEIYAVGATPDIIISTVSNEFDVTGVKILEGIRELCQRYHITDYEINGSSEENFPTTMTGFGITVVGNAKELRWQKTLEGDYCYLYGWPFVGKEVLENEDDLLNPLIIHSLFNKYDIHDFLPCGSGGIINEIEVLCEDTKLNFMQESLVEDSDPQILYRSAGPSTCGIFTTAEKIKEKDIQLIGYFTETEEE